MKKLLTLLCVFALVLSLCGTVFAEETEATPVPEMEKPVCVSVVDELGEPVPGAALQVVDEQNNVMEAWNAEDGDYRFFLKEGEYSIENLILPEGYEAESNAVPVTVERTEEEQGLYAANVVYDHNHIGICTNPNHVGIELYKVDGNTAYCFNHLKRNPENDVERYEMMVANPTLLWACANNKSDDIGRRELYKAVRSVIYLSGRIQEIYDLPDEVVVRYLTQMALKNYTDSKLFYTYDKDGNSTLMRDENGRPMRDANGKYMYNGEGCVLGSMINHAKGEGGLPQNYIDAYNYLTNSDNYPTEQELANYVLYIYAPVNTDNNDLIDENFQWMLSVKQVETQQVKVQVRAIPQTVDFGITIKWNDSNNWMRLRPSAASTASKLHLYADGVEVTSLYRGAMTVTDNHNGTYSVRVADLPKLNENGDEIIYTMKMNNILLYVMDKNVVGNGETLTCTRLGSIFNLPIRRGPIERELPILEPIIGPFPGRP